MEFRTAEDVTPELIDVATSIVDCHYLEGRVDWEDVWDRLENATLPDGSDVDLGGSLDSDAMREIKRAVKERRKEID